MNEHLMQARFALGKFLYVCMLLAALCLMGLAVAILAYDHESLGAFALNLFYATSGFLLLLTIASYLDHRIATRRGGHFSVVIEKIHGNELATAIYYGLRFAGICVLAAGFVRH